MLPEGMILTAALGFRNSHNQQIEDRMLADIGMTRAEMLKQKRRLNRKAR